MDYRKWIWIELIGFDNTQPDLGVGEYLDRLGFIPEVISLLIYSPDIVHLHRSTDEEIRFSADYSSYGAHPFNAERELQYWSNLQLKGLVNALHQHGVKVLPSFFSFHGLDHYHKEWFSDHQELFEVHYDGQVAGALNPLKRLKDGTPYLDFLLPKLLEAIEYYGFDGWHAADGWGHPRSALWFSDYSDDMVLRFVEASGVNLPHDLRGSLDGTGELFTHRSGYIWENHKKEWTRFHANLWAQFHKKVSDELKSRGLLLAMNSAWTRDPFEALYRYGVDYALYDEIGLEAMVTESAAVASNMEARGGDRHCNYVTALMLTGVHAPGIDLVYLNGLKDVMEQWDALRHNPAPLENEIYALSNVYKMKDKKLTRCAQGPVACLGDGIESLEWNRLKKMWDLAFNGDVIETSGPMLVWSPGSIDAQITDTSEHGLWSVHKTIFELARRGCWVTSAVRVQDLLETDKPLIVVNPHQFAPDEITRVMQCANGPLIAVGYNLNCIQSKGSELTDGTDKYALKCRIANGPEDIFNGVTLFGNSTEWKKDVPEPINFLYELNYRSVSEDFLKIAASAINITCGVPEILSNDPLVSARYYKLASGDYRVMLVNEGYSYSLATVKMHFDIADLRVSGPFPVAKLVPDGHVFSIKVPGKGVTLVDVTP